ncbi:MAG: hypothetical protein KC476_00595 [Cyanobacteria bacterium HKST-UBA06]|nr:hypothetical protein [Cyanobacteria bacterium HKST-UBA06]
MLVHATSLHRSVSSPPASWRPLTKGTNGTKGTHSTNSTNGQAPGFGRVYKVPSQDVARLNAMGFTAKMAMGFSTVQELMDQGHVDPAHQDTLDHMTGWYEGDDIPPDLDSVALLTGLPEATTTYDAPLDPNHTWLIVNDEQTDLWMALVGDMVTHFGLRAQAHQMPVEDLLGAVNILATLRLRAHEILNNWQQETTVSRHIEHPAAEPVSHQNAPLAPLPPHDETE